MRQRIQPPVSPAVTERPPCVARRPDFLLRSQAVEQERRTDERRTLGRLAALGGGVLLLAVLGLLCCSRPGPSAHVGCRTGVASGTCRRAWVTKLSRPGRGGPGLWGPPEPQMVSGAPGPQEPADHSRDRPPAPVQGLRSAPLGGAGAGGVAVGGQDLVSDAAAFALVRPFLGPHVGGALLFVFARPVGCFPQAS